MLVRYLENGNILSLVDHPLVDGVGSGEVDHLAQDDPVVHLLVHVAAVLAQPQLVPEVRVPAEVGVDPVCEGCLLLK